jgi:hypothetical protein
MVWIGGGKYDFTVGFDFFRSAVTEVDRSLPDRSTVEFTGENSGHEVVGLAIDVIYEVKPKEFASDAGHWP